MDITLTVPYLFSGAQCAEIFRRLWHGVVEQLEGNASSLRPLLQPAFRAGDVGNFDIKKHLRILRVGPPHFFLI